MRSKRIVSFGLDLEMVNGMALQGTNMFKFFFALIFFEALFITLLSVRKKDYANCVKSHGEEYAMDRKKILKILGPSLIAVSGLAWLAETFLS